MTETQRDYIKSQLEIIDKKTNKDDLIKYGMLLSVAKLDAEVKKYLDKGVNVKMKELSHDIPLVVAAGFE